MAILSYFFDKMNYIKDITLKLLTLFFIAITLFSFEALAMESEESQAYSNFIGDMVAAMSFDKSGTFCVSGNDDVTKAIIDRFPKAIRADEGIDKYSLCNIIYIAQGSERGLRIELEKLSEKRIVTIAIFDGFVNMGGMIQIQIGRRNFELMVNPKLLKGSGAKLGVLATNLIIN